MHWFVIVLGLVIGLFGPSETFELEVHEVYCVSLTCNFLDCDTCYSGFQSNYCPCCQKCQEIKTQGPLFLVNTYELIAKDNLYVEQQNGRPEITIIINGKKEKPDTNQKVKSLIITLYSMLEHNLSNSEDFIKLTTILNDILEDTRHRRQNIHADVGFLWKFLYSLLKTHSEHGRYNSQKTFALQAIISQLEKLIQLNPVDPNNPNLNFETDVLAESVKIMYNFDINLLIGVMRNLIETLENTGHDLVQTLIEILKRERPIMTKYGPLNILTYILKEMELLLNLVSDTVSNPLMERFKHIVTILKFIDQDNNINQNVDPNDDMDMTFLFQLLEKPQNSPQLITQQNQYLLVLTEFIEHPESQKPDISEFVKVFLKNFIGFATTQRDTSLDNLTNMLLNLLRKIENPENPLRDVNILKNLLIWLDTKTNEANTSELLPITTDLIKVSSSLFLPQSDLVDISLGENQNCVDNLIVFLQKQMSNIRKCSAQRTDLGITECELIFKIIKHVFDLALRDQRPEKQSNTVTIVLNNLREMQQSSATTQGNAFGVDFLQLLNTLQSVSENHIQEQSVTWSRSERTEILYNSRFGEDSKCQQLVEICDSQSILPPHLRKIRYTKCNPTITSNIITHTFQEYDPDYTWIFKVLNDLLLKAKCAGRNTLLINIREKLSLSSGKFREINTYEWKGVRNIETDDPPQFSVTSSDENYGWVFDIFEKLMRLTAKSLPSGKVREIEIGVKTYYFFDKLSEIFDMDTDDNDEYPEDSSEELTNDGTDGDYQDIFEILNKLQEGVQGPSITYGDSYNTNNFYVGVPPPCEQHDTQNLGLENLFDDDVLKGQDQSTEKQTEIFSRLGDDDSMETEETTTESGDSTEEEEELTGDLDSATTETTEPDI